MPKIDTIPPELFRDEDLFITDQQIGLPLRLAFIGLLTCCNREGHFKWQPRSLKLHVLPYDEVDFEQILDALCQTGFIQKVFQDDKTVGVIPSKTKKRPKKSLQAN